MTRRGVPVRSLPPATQAAIIRLAAEAVDAKRRGLPAKKKRSPAAEQRAADLAVARATCPSEHEEQAAFVAWADNPATRAKWPELEWLFAVPNFSGRLGRIPPAAALKQAAMLKAEGRRPGVMDLMLPVKRGVHPGLVIEMKRADRRLSRLEPEQRRWLQHFLVQGWAIGVCYGRDEAVRLTERYLARTLVSLPSEGFDAS